MKKWGGVHFAVSAPPPIARHALKALPSNSNLDMFFVKIAHLEWGPYSQNRHLLVIHMKEDRYV